MNNTVRLVAGIAAVGVAAFVGYQLLFAPNVGGPAPAPSDSPIPTASPTPVPSESAGAGDPVDFTALEGEGTPLDAGEYVIDYAAPIALVTFTVPDEPFENWPSPWYKAAYDWGPWHQSNAAALGVVDVENLYLDPCDPTAGVRDPAVGPTVDDLVAALGEVPGLTVSAPTETTIGGSVGQYVELTGDLPADCADDRSLWTITGGDPSLQMPESGDLAHAWIMDVEGERLVIFLNEAAGFTGQDAVEALLDSIVIEAP
jgi:hypothetical protein